MGQCPLPKYNLQGGTAENKQGKIWNNQAYVRVQSVLLAWHTTLPPVTSAHWLRYSF